MSYLGCIQGHLDAGRITEAQARKLQKQYAEQYEKYRVTHGDIAGAKAAANKQVARAAKILAEENASKLMEAAAQLNITREINQRYNKAKAEYDAMKPWQQKLANLSGNKPSKADIWRDILDTTQDAQQAIIDQILLPVLELVKKKPKYRDTELFRSLMKDVTGHVLGKQAATAEGRELGEAVKKSYMMSHKMYKINGGLIGYIENYFPQIHNSQKFQNLVSKIGREAALLEWKNYILPRLKLEKMIDKETGLPFTEQSIQPILDDIFETIHTDGLNKIHELADLGAEQSGKGTKLSKKRTDARFFHFKDADAYFEYNDKFGAGNDNLYDVVMSDLGTMGRDIGTMARLGPNPDSVNRNVQLKIAGSSPNSISWSNAIYNSITGKLSSGSADPNWYRVFSAMKDLSRSTMLGSTTLASIGDPMFGWLNARQHGLPGYNILKNLKAIRDEGGIDSESIKQFMTAVDMHMGGGISRFSEDPVDFNAKSVSGFEKFSASAAEGVHRISGLNWWTAESETLAAMGTWGSTSMMSASRFADLDDRVKAVFGKYGIEPRHWDIIRRADPVTVGRHGAKYIGPDQVAALGSDPLTREAAQKYAAFVKGMVDASINKPSARVRGIQTAGAKTGTIERAARGSLMMFKGFTASVIFNYGIPSAHRAIKGDLSDLGYFMTLSLTMGAMAIQLREIAKGNDPRNMNDPRFWKAAMMQGGGLGPLGDIFFAENDRFGRSPLVSMLGPQFGQVDDIRRIFLGNFERALEDSSYDSMNKFLTDLGRFASYQIPGQNLWYLRNQMRAILEAPMRLTDPHYYEKNMMRDEKRQEDYGNQSFHKPGDFLPSDTPNFGAMWQ